MATKHADALPELSIPYMGLSREQKNTKGGFGRTRLSIHAAAAAMASDKTTRVITEIRASSYGPFSNKAAQQQGPGWSHNLEP